METKNVVFEEDFDEETLAQIHTLRSTRLMMAERMLRDIDKTAKSLVERGLIKSGESEDENFVEELKPALEARVAEMRERLDEQDKVYADELGLFADLLVEDTLTHPEG